MKYRWMLLTLLLLLGGSYLWWSRPRDPVLACGYKVVGALSCYGEVLRPLIGKGEYAQAASLCLSIGDPECYRAFGVSVPNLSLCSLLRPGGLGAVHLCYHHGLKSGKCPH